MTDEQAKKLDYPFNFNEIEWRVLRVSKSNPNKAQVAAYVDSRAIQNRLDSVIGRENWQNTFESVVGNNNGATAHICRISIYYPERGEWITKSDGAGCTDVEPIKGGLSNAFKRAASMWGMGRYLYGLKNIWVNIDEYKSIAQNSYPELEKRYNQYVSQLLGQRQDSDKGNQQNTQQKRGVVQTKQEQQVAPQNPAPQPQVPPKSQQPAQNNVLPAGRFNGSPMRTQEHPTAILQQNGCRIVNLQVAKGAKNSQTLITLENAQGKQLTGYIQGEPPLKQGQIIFNPKITTKSSPLVGDYHIIESYNTAA